MEQIITHVFISKRIGTNELKPRYELCKTLRPCIMLDPNAYRATMELIHPDKLIEIGATTNPKHIKVYASCRD